MDYTEGFITGACLVALLWGVQLLATTGFLAW